MTPRERAEEIVQNEAQYFKRPGRLHMPWEGFYFVYVGDRVFVDTDTHDLVDAVEAFLKGD